MAQQRRATMMDPQIETLIERVDSKFTLVTLSARRARQINSYFNQLGEGLGAIVPPQVTTVSRKPMSISLEEIAADKITYERLPEGTGDEDNVAEALETEKEWGPVGTLTDAGAIADDATSDDPAGGDIGGDDTVGGEDATPGGDVSDG